MYRVLVWQRVTSMVFVLCGGVEACHMYGSCTVWCGVNLSYLSCVSCVVVWQHIIIIVSLLFGGVGASHIYA